MSSRGQDFIKRITAANRTRNPQRRIQRIRLNLSRTASPSQRRPSPKQIANRQSLRAHPNPSLRTRLRQRQSIPRRLVLNLRAKANAKSRRCQLATVLWCQPVCGSVALRHRGLITETPGQGCSFRLAENNAAERTRTSTPLRALGPQPSASANFATAADFIFRGLELEV